MGINPVIGAATAAVMLAGSVQASADQAETQARIAGTEGRVIVAYEDLGSRIIKLKGPEIESLELVKSLTGEKRGGYVRALATIEPDGLVTAVELADATGIPELDSAIVALILGWEFSSPRKDNGDPVTVQAPLRMYLGYFPKRLSGFDPAMPQEAIDAGHNGEIAAKGRIGPDGHVVDVEIVQSSDSPLLDAAMVAAMQSVVYEAPLGFDGEPVSLPTSGGHRFTQATRDGGNVVNGLKDYSCAAFVKEADWWTQAHPDKGLGDWFMYKLIGGAMILAERGKGGAGLLSGLSLHQGKFPIALEACRTKPNSTLLKEYGKART